MGSRAIKGAYGIRATLSGRGEHRRMRFDDAPRGRSMWLLWPHLAEGVRRGNRPRLTYRSIRGRLVSGPQFLRLESLLAGDLLEVFPG